MCSGESLYLGIFDHVLLSTFLGSLRPFRLSDLPRIGIVAAAGFYHSPNVPVPNTVPFSIRGGYYFELQGNI